MSILDAISQIGGGLGTAGAAVAGWVATKINEVKTAAEKAESARIFVEAALTRFRSELEALDTLKRGIKLEIENAKQTRESRPSAPFLSDPTGPSRHEMVRRIDAIERRLEEFKGDLTRERGARHAMQHQLSEDARQDEKQWRDMIHALGEIRGSLGLLRDRDR